jgi:hypothetical protein
MSNQKSSFVGTGTFLFVPGATTQTAFDAATPVDFGNIVSLSIDLRTEELRRFVAAGGIRTVDRTVVTQADLVIDLKIDDIGVEQLRAFLGASDGAGTKTGYTALQPMATFERSGMGVLRFYDAEDDDTSPTLIYEYFRCEVKGEGSIDFASQSFTEMGLRVTSTDRDAQFYVKNPAGS